MKNTKLKAKALEFIKEKFTDHDHCAQSARAVSMFMQGVEWVLEEQEKIETGPDIDGDVVFPYE